MKAPNKKPSFSEGYYGYSSFSELLEDAQKSDIVKLKKDPRAGTYVVTGFVSPPPQTNSPSPSPRSKKRPSRKRSTAESTTT